MAINNHFPRRYGEVITASVSEFTAQCYRLYDAPCVGDLVLCGEQTPVYGVVCEMATQTIDPERVIVPRGQDAATEADVLRQNPQIERLLCTRFRAIVVGYQDGDAVRRYLPSSPPRLYSFARGCDAAEVVEFSASHEFLATLLDAPIEMPDYVIASFLRQASAARPEPRAYLVSAGKRLAMLMRGHLPRLSRILASVE